MAWEIEGSGEYQEWLRDLTPRQQRDIFRPLNRLAQYGISLDHPYTSRVNSSRHNRMRELRVQSGGLPLRIFYAFDPLRTAILLIGGDKTGDDRFYLRYVPIADRIYDRHIDDLRRRGLI